MRGVRAAVLGAGAVFILLAFALNEWVVARLFSPDHHITSSSITWRIRICQALLLASGLLLIRLRSNTAGFLLQLCRTAVGLV